MRCVAPNAHAILPGGRLAPRAHEELHAFELGARMRNLRTSDRTFSDVELRGRTEVVAVFDDRRERLATPCENVSM